MAESVIPVSAHQWFPIQSERERRRLFLKCLLSFSPRRLPYSTVLWQLLQRASCVLNMWLSERGARGGGENRGAHACYLLLGAYLQFLQDLAPPLLFLHTAMRSRRVKLKGVKKRHWCKIHNGIFNHLRGAVVLLPVAAFRRICPTLDPAGFWLEQMRKRVFLIF